MTVSFSDLLRRLGFRQAPPERPQSALGLHLSHRSAPLGALLRRGVDVSTLIAAETDLSVLQAAHARARRTGDTKRMIETARRHLQLAPAPGLARDLAETLVRTGNPAEAEAILATIKPGQLPAPLLRQSQMLIVMEQGDYDAARAIADQMPDADRAEAQARLCNGYLQTGQSEKARTLAEAMLADRASDPRFGQLLIRAIFQHDGPEAAAAALDRAGIAPLIPEGSELWRAFHARALLGRGRFEECFETLSQTLTETPDLWSLYPPLNEAAWQSDLGSEAGALMDKAAQLYPERTDLLGWRCANASDLGDFDRAEALLPRLRDHSEWDYLSARFAIACQQPGRDAALAAFAACTAAGMPAANTAVALANYEYFYQATKTGLSEALARITPYRHKMGEDPGFHRLYLRLLIGLDRDAEARTALAALPRGTASDAAIVPFDLYFKAQDGKDDAARRGWVAHLARTAPQALNARSSPATTTALKLRENPDDIYLFLTVFNGMEYCDWFLEYYRTLGVSHFFVIDNASTDGTRDYMLAQPDVSLFEHAGSFRRSACGLYWCNDLMQRFGCGHWCLHVDMDEAFVFPNMDQGRTLRDFLSFLDAMGHESVPALMLDIYPADLNAPGSGDPFSDSRFIDRDYTFIRNEVAPYTFVQGGLRARLTGRSLMMTKAPLIRMARDVTYLANNHQHSHVPMSDVGCALLHYKFIGDIRARLNEAIERQEHFMGARFYKALAAPLGGAEGASVPKESAITAPSESLLSQHSVAYTGPAQLVDLGLMHSSSAWDRFNL